jgi:hypothetical protein
VEQAWDPVGAGLTVACKTKEGLEEHFGPKRWTKLDSDNSLASVDVPPTVSNPRRNGGFIAGLEDALFTSDGDSDLALAHDEAFLLAQMAMFSRHDCTRPKRKIEREDLSVTASRSHHPGDSLAANRILDR